MMDVSERLVEGYFIKTVDNLIFEVKGIVHPEDRTIAYLRYVPDSESVSGFRKIYDLRERENYLNQNFPEYLWFSKPHGRVVQSVPNEKVSQIFDPVEHMDVIREQSDSLSLATSRLVDLLIEYTRVSSSDIGVTGSQLIGVATETSDIDLIVLGKSECVDFYNNLKRNYCKIPGIEYYTGNLLKEHLSFRWGGLTKYHSTLEEIERRKVLQGIFREHQFFIRLVKRSNDFTEKFGQIISENLGFREIQCVITDDNESIFSPCCYSAESEEIPDLKWIISYRGRFTEHVSKGDTVNAKGRLEKVIDSRSNESYKQLVLGEESSDYLIPK
jgi:predicted nucleotidyltransferase